jgi:tetratricopeptide (TPR) repeat protein
MIRPRLGVALVLVLAAPLQAQSRAAARAEFDRLRATGRYTEAEAVARRQLTADPGWRVSLGDLLVQRGQPATAESLYRAALDGPDGLTAQLRLGLLEVERGALREGRDRLRAAVRTSAGRRLTSAERLAVGDGLRALGPEDPSRYREALRAYDAAITADSTDLAPRLAVGWLFLDKHNRPDALASFDDVLARHPGHAEALLGKAMVGLAEGTPNAIELLRQSLAANQNLVPARVTLARSHLDSEAWEDAAAEAGKALAVNPASQEALAVRAAARLLPGDSAAFDQDRRAALALNPSNAGFYTTLAEVSARNRLYREAVTWGRRAVTADSTASEALGVLGLNELRVGSMAEGRSHLERAFARDPFNVWYKNTLDLLDVMRSYRTTGSARFRFLAAPADSDLLTPYLAELAEAAYDRLAERYGYRPQTPVQLELFRHHADFSVRTVGLAGLGALGVSFGTVLAMDAPSARPRGEFNWGSTFWHELAHTFTLGTTSHRVPRWFSEGLSVLEERRARPGWGASVQLGFLKALEAGKLLPVSRLNDGFVRPTYPGQIGHAYYQASLVCEMIETTRGFAAIRAMLEGYRLGLGTAAVIRRGTGADATVFDREFDTWLHHRFRRQLAAVAGDSGGAFMRELHAASAAARAGRSTEALRRFEAARDLFPEYVEAGSPWRELARLHRQRGDLPRAAEALGRHTALAESDYEANLEEADVREAMGDPRGAAAALERAAYIDPRDPVVHARLAILYGRVNERSKAIRERRAIVALAPTDRADAYYQLALALYQAGDLASARREVLHALEIAPAFEPAQDLLLRIRQAGKD